VGLILLVRHGQASFGADDYDVLSPVGHEQGRELGRWLVRNGPVPATVVHGGMRRHRETWEAIAAGGVDAPEESGGIDEDWAEFDHLAVLAHYAATPGASVDHGADRTVFQRVFEESTGHWAAGHEGYPESYADFVARSRAALERVAAAPGPALVVTSGGVIAAVAAALVAPDLSPAELGPVWSRFNTVLANSSVTRVIVGSTGARLLTFNEHTHLDRGLLTYR
jgi:broad specificity phosphatase PhoE